MTNERLSRDERRRLRQADAPYLSQGMTAGNDPRPMGAHLRQIVRLLQDRTSRSPCSDAVGHLTTLYDRSVPPEPNLACHKGCSFCCSQDVTVTAPEAFFVAAAIRNTPTLIAAVLEADATLRNIEAEERLGRILCPLLTEQICSIYASRPLACHAFISVKLQACLDTFVDGKPPQIPMPGAWINLLYSQRMMLKAAIRLSGLDDQTYEMTAAVAAILRQDNAETRWLNGEPVFAAVKPDPPIPPQFETGINDMMRYIAPTL